MPAPTPSIDLEQMLLYSFLTGWDRLRDAEMDRLREENARMREELNSHLCVMVEVADGGYS